jgi:pimeloyl-ACP methyl ester carboxylesterase
MTGVAVGLLAILFVLTVTGAVRRAWIGSPPARVTSHEHAGKNPKQVFFYVHGFLGHRREALIANELADHGDVVGLRYSACVSNTEPLDVARALAREMRAQAEKAPDKEIVLIGESMGALLLRRAFLEAEGAWTKRIKRIVLLAGLNRGWDLTGHKPSDMSSGRWAGLYVLTWLARLTDSARLVMGLESGSPFVANLRLDWMERSREDELEGLQVVQLRGDIDDLVSEEDSRDLDSVAHANYASLRVRGTGHGDIANFEDETKIGGEKIGAYRRDKFLLAATESSFDKVRTQSEQEPFQVDPTVTHVVFVLHGIRDLGQWAAAFEQSLKQEFAKTPSAQVGRLEVASPRYGYLGMGPFLLLAKRQHYVQWLMDEYTEVRARYPNAREIHFFGHSNGTYLLASALERYESLKIGRVAFGGSVVSKRFDWNRLLDEGQVQDVRNYAAADDWVVALFPRFFEPRLMRRIFANDLGSAGFNGFESARVQNVRFLDGGHSAFEKRTQEISSFLVGTDTTIAPPPLAKKTNLLDQGAKWATWFIVWPLLALVLTYVGWHVVMSATEPRWPFVMVYVLLVLFILKSA